MCVDFAPCQTGQLQLEGRFPRWRTPEHNLREVLAFVKGILYLKDFSVDQRLALNPEALDLCVWLRAGAPVGMRRCMCAGVCGCVRVCAGVCGCVRLRADAWPAAEAGSLGLGKGRAGWGVCACVAGLLSPPSRPVRRLYNAPLLRLTLTSRGIVSWPMCSTRAGTSAAPARS